MRRRGWFGWGGRRGGRGVRRRGVARRPAPRRDLGRPGGDARRGALAALVALAAPVWVLLLRAAVPDVLALPAAPDALALAVGAAAWTFPPASACLFAASAGLLGDVASDPRLGLAPLRLVALALVWGRARASLNLGGPAAGATLGGSLAVALFALVERALAAVAVGLAVEAPAWRALLGHGLDVGLASAAAAPLALIVARRLAPEQGP